MIYKLIDYVLLFLIAGAFLLSLVVSPNTRLSVNDNTFHSASIYKSFLDAHFRAIKNRNKITVDEEQLVAQLRGNYPEVQSAVIELPLLGQRPNVTVVVSTPQFYLNQGGNSYIVSSTGVAVGQKDSYPLKHLTVIDDQSGYQVRLGKTVLNRQAVLFLESLAAELKAHSVPVKSFVLPNSPAQVNVYTTDAAYYTKFFMGGDAKLQIGQYLAARNNFKTTAPPDQYLDVRVTGKAFFK